ncbi:MAG: PAS domain S-box protein [Acidobacteria bacterium]|nr:PAS domain S-box protein [Acidobacteriota bacterium]
MTEDLVHAISEHSNPLFQLLDSAGDMMDAHALDGTVIEGNDAALTASGYSRAEVLNLKISNVLLPAAAEAANGRLARGLQGGHNTRSSIGVLTRSGGTMPLEITSTVSPPLGQPVAVIGVGRRLVANFTAAGGR